MNNPKTAPERIETPRECAARTEMFLASQRRDFSAPAPSSGLREALADAIISDYVQSQTKKRNDKTPLPLATLKQIIIQHLATPAEVSRGAEEIELVTAVIHAPTVDGGAAIIQEYGDKRADAARLEGVRKGLEYSHYSRHGTFPYDGAYTEDDALRALEISAVVKGGA